MTASIAKLQHKLQLARKASARTREKAGELMEHALDAGITSGTAMALGVWSKKAPGSFKDMGFGVPSPLALALGGYAASLFGVGRGMEKHIRSVANGCLAVHGFCVGQDYAGSVSAPSLPSSQGAGVSTQDLVNLARG